MEAVILVGGLGTRLRPLTLTTPKNLLPVANIPFIGHQFTRLAAAGVSHVVLATSYRAELFAEHFGDGSDLGIELSFVTETEALGTGGGIRNVSPALRSAGDEPVLILNGDVLSGHDMSRQVEAHRMSDAAVTLHLVAVDDARAFGCVPTDDAGRVLEFVEKSPDPPTNRINAGCYVFRRSIIDTIPAGRVVSVERETFPDLLSDGQLLMSYSESAYWLDVGTPRALVKGSADVVRGLVPGTAVALPGESLIASGAVTDGADVTGGTAVAGGARIDAGSSVRGSIVMAEADIGPDCDIADSVIGSNAVLAAGCVVRDAVIGDRAQLGEANELAAGVRLWSDAVIPAGALKF